MIIEHQGKRPDIAPSVRVAPTATICGDVTIEANCSIGFGAILTAEGGPIKIGSNSVIMDTAVLRGTRANPLTVGCNVMIGPRACLTGCTVADEAFLATGATVFNGALIGRRAEVRINGTVHLRTVLPDGATVPIGWIAVGDPARILPPEDHEAIWAIQRKLDFPEYVFGVKRGADGSSNMIEMMSRYSRALRGWHKDDKELP